MSLSTQIYIQLLKRTLAKALSQHLACLKICVISFIVNNLIIDGCFSLRSGVLHKEKECLHAAL